MTSTRCEWSRLHLTGGQLMWCDGEHKYLLLAFWQAWRSLSEDVYSPITGLLVSGTVQTGDCLASLPLAIVHAASPVMV